MRAKNQLGDVIRERIKTRGWTQGDLARIVGKTPAAINEIIQGRRGITPEMASLLTAALGENADFWLTLGAKNRSTPDEGAIERTRQRARLYELAPVKEMQRRGWISDTTDLEQINSELCGFFETESLVAEPEFPVATRRSDPLADLNAAQRAWCFRARNIAKARPGGPFDPGAVEGARHKLRELARHPKDARHVPDVLSRYGIRFVIVEPIRSSGIDGAAFWIDDGSPAIAMSLRYDRIDYFWFTLMHEFAHISHGDRLSIDAHLVGDGQSPTLLKDEGERRADRVAAESLISPGDLDSFMRRVGPMYSKPTVIGFAKRIRIHAAIVVGQLQYCGELGWNSHREMLEKVRDIIVGTSIVDGWGCTLPPTDVDVREHEDA